MIKWLKRVFKSDPIIVLSYSDLKHYSSRELVALLNSGKLSLGTGQLIVNRLLEKIIISLGG